MTASKELSAGDRQVLTALAQADAPRTTKQVAAEAGLEAKEVSKIIGALKKQGLVDSPVRCKYAATEQGRGQAAS